MSVITDIHSIPSIGRILTLHPLIRQAAINATVEAQMQGYEMLITSGMRTFAQQAVLYAQGRTTPGKIVTQADAGQSYHNYGLAMDFCVMQNGIPHWHVDETWSRVASIFKSHGFAWGGDWEKFHDYGHLEKTYNHAVDELRKLHDAGKMDAAGYLILADIASD